MTPLVSIIMPSYNAERFIAQSIESVIAQTYENWELLITDDCSYDKTVDVVKEYCEKDKRIAELENSLERRQRWFNRLQTQYAELNAETEELRQRVADLSQERDALIGDVTKLKALVAELEAKLPPEPKIILP